MSNYPMTFYHQDGLVPAWQFASRYAGEGGRIATLPDIIAARLATKPGKPAWEQYFTTTTAEYFGRSRGGNWILVVAHGVGPMASMEGALAAYRHEYQDKTRRNRGGRITQQQFWDLEAGTSGEVSIVTLETIIATREYPFYERLRADEIMDDPVLVARLGPRAEEFMEYYRELATAWHQEQYGIDPENTYGFPDWEKSLARRRHSHLVDRHNPYLIFSSGASNCPYGYRERDGSFKIGQDDYEVKAHLVSIGQLMHVNHDGHESLATDIRCHEWHDGVRLAAIPRGSRLSSMRSGPESVDRLVKQHWRRLLEPVPKVTKPGFRSLMKIGGVFLSQYPKRGASMDTHEPEYEVTSSEPIGLPIDFETTIGGYEGFFRYDMAEVRALAPRTANAYEILTTPTIIYQNGDPVRHRTRLQFYRVVLNTALRVPRADKLRKDFDTLLSLVS
jgi:hypothetical protein